MISSSALQSTKAGLESYYSLMHERMRSADALYNQMYVGGIEIPEGIEVYRSSRASTIVDELRDQIRVNEPRVSARAWGTSKKAKELQAIQAMWGTATLAQTGRDTPFDPIAQIPFDLLLRGAACVKTLVKPEFLVQTKSQKGMWPFVVQAVDPLRVMPSPGYGPLKYVIEVQYRRAIDVKEKYPYWSDPQATKLSARQRDNLARTSEWVEFWSWVYDAGEWRGDYVVEADGERVIELDNPYGFVPYSWRYSGLGRVNWDGDPATQAVSVLTPLMGELKQEILLKTAASAAWQFHVFPILVVEGMTAQDAKRKLQKGPGAIVSKPAGATMEYLPHEQPNVQMLDFIGRVDQAIDRRVSPSLGGTRQADYGIHQALLLGQALKVVQPVKAALNTMGADVLNMMAALAHRFSIDQTVAGTVEEAEKSRVIKHMDLARHEFEVEFEAVDPTENDRKMLALLAVQRVPGLLSRETYRKLANLTENNEEEEDRIMGEALQDQLVMSGALLPLAMEFAKLELQGQPVEAAGGRVAQAVGQAPFIAGARERGVEELLGGQTSLAEPREAAQEGQTQ